MSADKTTTDVPDEAIESLLPLIRAYFESDEGQEVYAKWQAEKKMAYVKK